MASIATFPAELLLQIFNDEVLTSADLARCARICWRFHDLINSHHLMKKEYTFQMDHTSQSAWKLIRCLLSNPKIGERIRKIRITWHRRWLRNSRTWTPKWYWADNELVDIYSICEKWSLTRLYPAVRDGLNSEALLPLLLCYTTKLESLDLGNISSDMVYDLDHRAHDVKRMYDHCVGFDHEWDPENWHEIGGALYNPNGRLRKLNTPWIYSTFNRLPGLCNIKKFSHGDSKLSVRVSSNTWPYRNLLQVLLLPRIETVRLDGAFGAGVPKIPVGKSNNNSSIKRLELIECRFYKEDYQAIVTLTGSLESFKCVLPNRKSGFDWFCRVYDCGGTRASEKNVADIFLRGNMKTLTRHQISVTTNSDDFYNDIKYKDEYEGDPYCENIRRYYENIRRYCENIGYPGDIDPDGHDDDDFWWNEDELEAEDKVTTRTRDVKGRKTRSHFVK